MKVTKIAYEQLFPTGVYQNQRLYAEASIDDMESPTECYFKLQKIVNDAFVSMNPNIVWNESSQKENSIEYSPEETGLRNILHVATTKKNLELFRKKFYDTKDEKLIEEFESKLNQLP